MYFTIFWNVYPMGIFPNISELLLNFNQINFIIKLENFLLGFSHKNLIQNFDHSPNIIQSNISYNSPIMSNEFPLSAHSMYFSQSIKYCYCILISSLAKIRKSRKFKFSVHSIHSIHSTGSGN